MIQFISATFTLSAQHNIPYILPQESVYNRVYNSHSYPLSTAQYTIYYHNNLYIIEFISATVTLSAQHNIPYILSQQSVYNTFYICHSYPLNAEQYTLYIITTVCI
jgi:hypothetical protein